MTKIVILLRSQEEVSRGRYPSWAKVNLEIRKLFDRLELDGHRIVLISSPNTNCLHLCEPSNKTANLLKGLVPVIVPREPGPDLFVLAFHLLDNFELDEAIVISANLLDVLAAKKAGLRTIGLLGGGVSKESFLRSGCKEVYQNPSDLLKQYDQSLLTEQKCTKTL